MNRILKLFAFLVAAIYFLVDAVFWTLAEPIIRWLAARWIFDSVRTWIMSLGPYPTLALFILPVLVLEPAKPVAAYLAATGHVVSGIMLLSVAELLKLVLIERLFRISSDKLMSIRAFAWCHGKFQQARNWVESLSAWQLMQRLSLSGKHAVRRFVLQIKTSRKRARLSWLPR